MRPRTSLPTTMLSPLTSSMIASTRPISIAAKSIVTRFAGPPNSEATAAVVRIHSGRPAPQRRPLHAPTHRKSRTDPPLFPLFPPSLSFRLRRGRAEEGPPFEWEATGGSLGLLSVCGWGRRGETFRELERRFVERIVDHFEFLTGAQQDILIADSVEEG